MYGFESCYPCFLNYNRLFNFFKIYKIKINYYPKLRLIQNFKNKLNRNLLLNYNNILINNKFYLKILNYSLNYYLKLNKVNLDLFFSYYYLYLLFFFSYYYFYFFLNILKVYINYFYYYYTFLNKYLYYLLSYYNKFFIFNFLKFYKFSFISVIHWFKYISYSFFLNRKAEVLTKAPIFFNLNFFNLNFFNLNFFNLNFFNLNFFNLNFFNLNFFNLKRYYRINKFFQIFHYFLINNVDLVKKHRSIFYKKIYNLFFNKLLSLKIIKFFKLKYIFNDYKINKYLIKDLNYNIFNYFFKYLNFNLLETLNYKNRNNYNLKNLNFKIKIQNFNYYSNQRFLLNFFFNFYWIKLMNFNIFNLFFLKSKLNFNFLYSYNYSTNFYLTYSIFNLISKKNLFFKSKRFNINIYLYYLNFFIRYFEYCTGRKFYLFLDFNLFSQITFFDLIKINIWSMRLQFYKRAIGMVLYINESIQILWLSLFFKDSYFFINWVKVIIGKISFWKHRNFIKYIKLLLISLIQFNFHRLNIKGVKLQIKGKLNVAGNARQRLMRIKIGKTSHAIIKNRINYDQQLIKTFTGVLGLKLWIYY